MKMSGQKISLEQTIQAMILDELRFQSWTHSKDAHKGRPYNGKSTVKALNGEYTKDKDELMSFKTIEEYERYIAQFEE